MSGTHPRRPGTRGQPKLNKRDNDHQERRQIKPQHVKADSANQFSCGDQTAKIADNILMMTISNLKVLDDHFGVGHRRIISKLLPTHHQLLFGLKQNDNFNRTKLNILRKEGEIHATLELHLHLHVLADVVSGSDGEEEGGAEDEV